MRLVTVKTPSTALSLPSPSNNNEERPAFHKVAQVLIKKYYLTPYPGALRLDEKNQAIARYYHGGLHVSCAVLADQLFMALLKKYFPENYDDILREFNNGKNLDKEEEALLQYGLLCHDAGNTSEKFEHSQAHADIFRREMLQLKFNPQKIERIALCIAKKDHPIADIYRMRLHDGDCWEFIRIQARVFNKEHLEIVKLFRCRLKKEILQIALHEVDTIIEYYTELSRYLYQDVVHKNCEFAENCYEMARKEIIDYHQQRQRALLQTFIPHDKEFIKSITSTEPPSFYKQEFDDKNHDAFKRRIFDYPLLDLKTPEPSLMEQHTPLFTDFKEGYFIRRIKNNGVEEELQCLQENLKDLKSHNINFGEELYAHFISPIKEKHTADQKKLNRFKFRPMQFIKKDCLINRYGFQKMAGLILNPKKLMIGFRYKSNVFSNTIESQKFDFKRPARKKNLGSNSALQKKIEELEARRRGELFDNYNRYFGLSNIPHNESLGNYTLNDVIGIAIEDDKVAAQDAIFLWQAVYNATKRKVPFCRYSGTRGLESITEDEVLYWAGIRKENSYYPSHLALPIEKFQALKIVYTGAEYQNSAMPAFSITNLQQLTCSLSQDLPSKEKPVIYEFQYVFKLKILYGKAYFKAGIPVIELDGRCFYDHHQILPKIAHVYEQEQIISLNQELLCVFENSYRIKHLHLSLQQQDTKRYLILNYEKPCMQSPQQILMLMGYTYKWELISASNSKKIEIRLSVIQALAVIKRAIRKEYQKHLSQEANKLIIQTQNNDKKTDPLNILKIYRKAVIMLQDIPNKTIFDIRNLIICFKEIFRFLLICIHEKKQIPAHKEILEVLTAGIQTSQEIDENKHVSDDHRNHAYFLAQQALYYIHYATHPNLENNYLQAIELIKYSIIVLGKIRCQFSTTEDNQTLLINRRILVRYHFMLGIFYFYNKKSIAKAQTEFIHAEQTSNHIPLIVRSEDDEKQFQKIKNAIAFAKVIPKEISDDRWDKIHKVYDFSFFERSLRSSIALKKMKKQDPSSRFFSAMKFVVHNSEEKLAKLIMTEMKLHTIS